MRLTTATAVLIALAFTASVPGAAARTGAPGSTPGKPNKVATVPTPPPGGPDKFTTRTQPPRPGSGPRHPTPIDDLAGHPNQAHVLPPGTFHCTTDHSCNWLAKKCDEAGGGMSQNPPDSPGGYPSQTCTIY